MEFITQPHDAAKKLFRDILEHPDEYPDDVRAHLLRLLEPGEPIALAVSESAEIIYARKGELSKRTVGVGAEMAFTASYNRINNFADSGGSRGNGIALALRRHAGEKAPAGMIWPPKEEDPTPKTEYVPVKLVGRKPVEDRKE